MHQDIIAQKGGSEWQRQKLPDTLSDEALHLVTEVMLLASRVRDEFVRVLADRLRGQSTAVGSSANRSEAELRMAEAAETQSELINKIGKLVRDLDGET